MRHEEFDPSDVQLFLSKSQVLFENNNKRFNFDHPRDQIDDEYRLLINLSSGDFYEFVEIVSLSSICNTSNQSIRTAMRIYLSKFHFGLSNRLLACTFPLPNKRTVSHIIKSAGEILLKIFVPYNLGFGHVSLQDVIDHCTTTIARELMCDGSADAVIIVIDDIYIYIEVRNKLKYF